MGDNGKVERNFHRQLDLVDMKQLAALPVTIIGAGGIGSPTALTLARMGVERITVYDFDTVEDHNLATQSYRLKDIGRKKVEALAEIVAEATGTAITAKAERWVAQPLRGVVIAAVDSIEVRKEIWAAVKERPAVRLFIEGRMGGEHYHVFGVRPCDPAHIRRYEVELFPKEQAAELPCTARAIIFNVQAIAADIGNMVKREVMRAVKPDQEVPFHIIRDFASMEQIVGM